MDIFYKGFAWRTLNFTLIRVNNLHKFKMKFEILFSFY